MLVYLNRATELPGRNEWRDQSNRMHAQPNAVTGEKTAGPKPHNSFGFFYLLKWSHIQLLLIKTGTLGTNSITLEYKKFFKWHLYSNILCEI